MKSTFLTYYIIISALVVLLPQQTIAMDSIGRRIENGKIVILHKVESKQTVYAISKIYDVPPERIYHDNPTAEVALKVGQILKIRTDRDENGTTTSNVTTSNNQEKTHTVQMKQTLYAISKIYNVNVDEIKEWNGLTSNELSTGQVLKIKKINTIDNSTSVNSTPEISITKVTTNEKTHVVEPKQTLYAISKLYNVSVEDIKSWNGLTTNELSTGQTLIVSGVASKPKPIVTAPVVAKSKISSNNFNPDSKFHTVEKGETLFSLSRKYNIEINDLAEWNNLTSNNLSEGQLLIINGSSSSSTSAMDALRSVNSEEKAQYTTINNSSNSVNKSNTTTEKLIDKYEVDENHEEKMKVEAALALTQQNLDDHNVKKQEYTKAVSNNAAVAKSTTTTSTNGDKNHWYIPSNVSTYEDSLKYGLKTKRTGVGQYKKIVETGICELIEDDHWDTKYNALHASAEKGTIIQVRNPANDISVFVRVVGRLVETSENKGDVIKISHHAVERLAPERSRFPVEISYLP